MCDQQLRENMYLSVKRLLQKILILLFRLGEQRLKSIFCFATLGMIFSSSTVTFLPQYVLKHSKWSKKLDTFNYRAYPDPKLLIHYKNIGFPCIDLSVTMDHNISQNLQLLIFNSIFWSMFLPFFTSLQVVFPTKFLMNFSCNIIVPSPLLLLCRLFTFAHNVKYCFTFLVTHSTKSWLGCFIYLVFHKVSSNFQPMCSTQRGFGFTFQVTFSQPVPCFFFICCFWLLFFKHSIHYFVFP